MHTPEREPPYAGAPRGLAPTPRRTRALPIAAAVVLAAVAFTVAYSRRAAEVPAVAGDAAGSAPDSMSPQAGAATATPVVAEQPRIAVTFRLDPAVTRGLYLGDRWVSPPVFRFAQPGDRYMVQARLQQIDGAGEAIDLSGDWAASDPGMVAIERGVHDVVTLIVREPGRSRVTVTSGTRAAVLDIRAQRTGDAMDVTITQ